MRLYGTGSIGHFPANTKHFSNIVKAAHGNVIKNYFVGSTKYLYNMVLNVLYNILKVFYKYFIDPIPVVIG